MTYIEHLLIRMAVWQWLHRNGEPLGDHVRTCELCHDLIEMEVFRTGLSNSPCVQCQTAGVHHVQQDHPYEPNWQHDGARMDELRDNGIVPGARCTASRVACWTCGGLGEVGTATRGAAGCGTCDSKGSVTL